MDKTTAALARLCANKPIHVIILTSLLASFAYLSVVEEYVPEHIRASDVAGPSFYHPGGSSAYSEWIPIESNQYPETDRFTVAALRFRRGSDFNFNVPDGVKLIKGSIDSEKFVISSSDKIDLTLEQLDRIEDSNGVVWKARNANRIAKYYEYLTTSFQKIRSLIAGAESFDIAMVTLAYLAMWYTLIKVFIDMHNLGLNFWLAFGTLVLSAFAFLFALLVTTKWFPEFKVSVVSLSEGIPFLVAIIGFKHKLSIAKTVVNSQMRDVPDIVGTALKEHALSVLRDSFVAIGALVACAAATPTILPLRNFCVLSALILSIDLFLVYTFYAALLALKVEINRAKRRDLIVEVLEENGVLSSVAESVANVDKTNEDTFLFPIVLFKVLMVAIFIGLQLFLNNGWSNLLEKDNYSTPTVLSKTAAKNIQIGSNGVVVTVLSPIIYQHTGPWVRGEEFILSILEAVSSAIRDRIISKFLLFAFVISIFVNAYLLNGMRVLRDVRVKAQNLKKKATKPVSTSELSSIAITANVSKITPVSSSESQTAIASPVDEEMKSLEECIQFMDSGKLTSLNDSEVSSLVVSGKLPLYALEKKLADNTRAVAVRRKAVAKFANVSAVDSKKLPYLHYDYDRVFGACCENVIGFMPLPVGVAGPLNIDGKPYYIPMATTEGCLVASTMRGCKAMNAGGGVQTVLTHDGMTRGPCVEFPTLARAGAAKIWLDSEEGQSTIKKAFNLTSRFARLQHIKTAMAGNMLFIRFKTTTGDAMGMNMISKGVEFSLKHMVEECGWEDMNVVSVSGNYCTDKKAAAINWIEGRGKSVVAEAIIPAEVVKKVLKSDVDALVQLNVSKNLVGSAMAGSIGGFNAHAANLVTAVFLACGQDPAQNVESSNCITLMSKLGDDLRILVSMPSIEVGTIGGGTILEPQGAMLELLGVKGPHPTEPGANARQLAKIVASAVLAAELSLASALAAGHLVQSHMTHNRAGAAAAPVSNGSAKPSKPSKPAAVSTADLARLKEGAAANPCIR